jgi:predicted esterase
MLARTASPSDTAALVTNLAPLGVYVLHGDADDVVPPSEARAMLARLAPFHKGVLSHFQPGAGHWWDASDEPGVRQDVEMFHDRRERH